MKRTATTETNALTRSIIRYIEALGGMAWRNNTGTRGGIRYGKKGSGDVFALYKGRFYSVELKTGRDTLSEDQARWIAEVRQQGGTAVVAYSIDDVIKAIPSIRESEK